jgi:hypothetical protein
MQMTEALWLMMISPQGLGTVVERVYLLHQDA